MNWLCVNKSDHLKRSGYFVDQVFRSEGVVRAPVKMKLNESERRPESSTGNLDRIAAGQVHLDLYYKHTHLKCII